MNTNVKAIVDAFMADDYSMMKDIFEKRSVNEDDFQLMLLNSKDNKSLQNLFTIKAINTVHTMIEKIKNVQIRELDLSEFYPEIIEGKEYSYSIFDQVVSKRNESLLVIREEMNLNKKYLLTPLESACLRFLSLNKPTDFELDFIIPLKEVEVEYCLEPFKFIESSTRGYSNNRYVKFDIDESNILHHKTNIQISYPKDFEQSDLKVRKIILKEMIDSINQTQNMVNELTRRLELEVLYDNIKNGLTAKEELERNIDEHRATLLSVDAELNSKQTELDSLIEEVTALNDCIAELEDKKEQLHEIAEKELERDKIDILLAEIAAKNEKYEHYLKIADKIDYYDSMETEMKLWQHCYMNMKEIASKLSQADYDLKEKQKEVNDEKIRIESELTRAKTALETEYDNKIAALHAKEEEIKSFKNANESWKASVKAEYEAKMSDYEDLKAELEKIKAENEQLKVEKKNAESRVTKLENALEVIKSSWTQ